MKCFICGNGCTKHSEQNARECLELASLELTKSKQVEMKQ